LPDGGASPSSSGGTPPGPPPQRPLPPPPTAAAAAGAPENLRRNDNSKPTTPPARSSEQNNRNSRLLPQQQQQQGGRKATDQLDELAKQLQDLVPSPGIETKSCHIFKKCGEMRVCMRLLPGFGSFSRKKVKMKGQMRTINKINNPSLNVLMQ
jgi:hypothetical protein